MTFPLIWIPLLRRLFLKGTDEMAKTKDPGTNIPVLGLELLHYGHHNEPEASNDLVVAAIVPTSQVGM